MPNVDMVHQPYWTTMGPMMILTATAFLVMVLEFIFRKGNRRWLTLVSIVGVIAALAVALQHFYSKPQVALYTVAVDAFGSVFSVLILITALLVLLFSFDYAGRVKIAAEHTYLILFAVVGALSMATAIDLITLYVGLELLSVSSYVLVAIRTKSIRSVEGGVKYLLMGSIGSAVLLYGMSFVYGLTGSTNLASIAGGGTQMFDSYPAITVLAFLMILGGMGFKLSLVPFHMWTPDAYDGAPSPVTAFLSTLSKAASFAMLLRLFLFIFYPVASHLFYWAGILAAVTMIVGNFIALPQRNMKRLLAFSSIAQAGYVMIPFALLGTLQLPDYGALFDSIAFYLFAYTFMTVGALAIVHVVSNSRNSIDSDALIGLYRRSPWIAVALTIFLLSMAGMPLTAGFVGKFYIFANTLHGHAVWLGILLFATSVVSFYYYFGLIRKVFQKDTMDDGIAVRPTATMHALVALCVIGTLLLGLIPNTLLHALLNTTWFYSG